MNEEEAVAVAVLLGMKQVNGMQALATDSEKVSRKSPKVSSKHRISSSESTDSRCFAPSEDVNPRPVKRSRKKETTKAVVVVEPDIVVKQSRVIQVCVVPKTHVNHTYSDMSNVPPGDDYVVTADLRQMTFAEKLHQILSREDLSDCISWIPHGRAFRIVMPKRLEERSILQVYFGHNRYSTFLGQLKNYGLKQITQGKDKHCFYNEFLLRGLPHLCKYMKEFKSIRKLKPDPKSEPDLAAVSKLWPIPMKAQYPSPATVEKGLGSRLLPHAMFPVHASSGESLPKAADSTMDEPTMSPVSVVQREAHFNMTTFPQESIAAMPINVDMSLLNSLLQNVQPEVDDQANNAQAAAATATAEIAGGRNVGPANNLQGDDLLSFFLAPDVRRSPQQVYSSTQLEAQAQGEFTMASLLQASLLSPNNKLQPSPQDIAAVMLMAELQQLQAQSQQAQVNNFVTSLLHMIPTVQQQQPPPNQEAGASSSELDGAALASVLIASLLQQQQDGSRPFP